MMPLCLPSRFPSSSTKKPSGGRESGAASPEAADADLSPKAADAAPSGKPRLRGDLPDFLLGQFPERHERGGELLLREPVQHIGLVFLRVLRFFDRVTAVVQPDHRRVMSRRHIVRLQHLRRVQHALPLHIPVARDAGIGRLPADIGADKGADHLFHEI